VKRAIAPLLLILLTQCLLVAALYWPRTGPASGEAHPPLVPFAPAAVDEIRIQDGQGNRALLRLAGERWILPELGGLPAASGRIEDLLHTLAGSRPDWPVADSAAARQRLQVADYRYQRRLEFLGDGASLGTLYLGTAPAFRSVHARAGGQDAIYSLQFNAFDAPAENDAWLDRALLQIRGPLEITADAYSLAWRDGAWLSGSGKIPEERELKALLDTLRGLTVEGVASEEQRRELGDAEASLVIEVGSLAGEVTLTLFALEGNFFVHSSEYDRFFRLGARYYDRLTGIDILRISGEGG